MNLTLLTDFYQLSMAYGYWKNGKHEDPATFNLYFRKIPFGGQYAICAGLHSAVKYLDEFGFSWEDLEFVRETFLSNGIKVEEAFIQYLGNIKFSCSVFAIKEGTLVFPNQPLMRISGPIIQAQLVETALLNIINFQTLIATKADRVCEAANGGSVLEFGLRRAQGPDGGLMASRAAYIGGVSGTSNVLAGQMYGIPVKGTHAHSWVMSFPTELEAFRAYASASQGTFSLLVDTFDTAQGVDNAIQVAKEFEGVSKLVGIRLDSGDLIKLSKMARNKLDNAGLKDVSIFASNDLDEYEIKRLLLGGAKIDIWGVGTKLVTSYDQPALGGVYKMSLINGNPVIKMSNDPEKLSLPGSINVSRQICDDRVVDVIHDDRYESFKGHKVWMFEPLRNIEVAPFNLLEELTGITCEMLKDPVLSTSMARANLIRSKSMFRKLFNEGSGHHQIISDFVKTAQEGLLNRNS